MAKPRQEARLLMRRIVRATGMLPAIAALILAGLVAPASAVGGFNQYGYNYGAHIFSGLADGVDKNLDGAVWGDPTYANDHLVMKWNAAWDACNANGFDDPAYCAGAWVTNEWNGMLPGGSQWTEHVKIIWVGSAATNSAYWIDGGYSIWGNYEAILDKGMAPGHIRFVYASATPNGLGRNN